jgi:hypothetical protein
MLLGTSQRVLDCFLVLRLLVVWHVNRAGMRLEVG